MWNHLYLSLTLAALIVLSYTDIKNRTAPNQITYGLLITGLGLHIVQSAVQETIQPFLYSLFGIATMFVLAYTIYLLGGWAGGDVKLFTALGATIPFYGALSNFTYPLPFPILILAASTIAVLPFTIIYGLHELIKQKTTELKEDIVKSLPKSAYSGFVLTATLHLTRIINIHPSAVLLIAPLVYIAKEPGYPVTAFLFTLSLINNTQTAINNLLFFLAISVLLVTGIKTYQSMKKHALREEKQVKDLKEGEIPAQDVWEIEKEESEEQEEKKLEKREPTLFRYREPGKIIIDSRKARGLTEKEIETLKESEIEKINIKKSLPFIPILTLGLVILIAVEIYL